MQYEDFEVHTSDDDFIDNSPQPNADVMMMAPRHRAVRPRVTAPSVPASPRRPSPRGSQELTTTSRDQKESAPGTA